MLNETKETKPFAYIDKAYLETYGLVIDESEENFKDLQLYINYACERINSISGGEIEKIKFENLNSIQQLYVQKATSMYCVWLYKNGMQFFRGGMSISSQGISISQNGPEDPDYLLKNIYYLLQQAQLYSPRAYFNDFSDNQPINPTTNPTQEQPFDTGPFSGCDYPISYRVLVATVPKGDNIHWISSDKSVEITFSHINGEIEKTVDIKVLGGTGSKPLLDTKYLKYNDKNEITLADDFAKNLFIESDDPIEKL